MIKENHEKIVLNKRKRYTHSEMAIGKGRQLLQELDITVVVKRSHPTTSGDLIPVEAFMWDSARDRYGQGLSPSEEQRERYRAYVEDNIGSLLSKNKLCVFDVRDKEVLNVKIPGHNIELIGSTDLLVLSHLAKDIPSNLPYLPDVMLVIEVKREVKEGDDFQILSKLVALSILAKDPVMALLTDLNHDWWFFWVSEEDIYKVTITKPEEAFQVIRAHLEQPPAANPDTLLPCIGAPVKRRKVTQLLSARSGNGDGGSIREAIERYYDIESMLGPDIEMARALGRQIVRSIPTFSTHT